MRRILVTGSRGQIGSELVTRLRQQYEVVATDLRIAGTTEYLDATNETQLRAMIRRHDCDTIIHLASLLSGKAEQNPGQAIAVNMRSTENVLRTANLYRMRVMIPSSISVFGPEAGSCPGDKPVLRPQSIYGVSKVYCELLGEWYRDKHGLDFRSLRYPGVISSLTEAGGGTTDYAVDIFRKVAAREPFRCNLDPDTALPMIYMPDLLDATVRFLEADRPPQATYNLGALSFTPAELHRAIQKVVPEAEIQYRSDPMLQRIADSWPDDVDDQAARRDWHHDPQYCIDGMVRDMLDKLSE